MKENALAIAALLAETAANRTSHTFSNIYSSLSSKK